jgi:hypothetical protein
MMDDDDVAFPDALERHHRIFQARPEVGFTYSNFLFAATAPDGRLLPGLEAIFPDVSEEDLNLRLMERNFLAQPGVVVRAECYRAVGPFRPDLIRGQDGEMIKRLARRFRGARVSGPTYYWRQHEGVRGSKTFSFPVEERERIWREGGRNFAARIRREYDLREYLPPGRGDAPLTPAERRRAFLQRMAIMGARGLYDDMFEDLALATGVPEAAGPLTPPEREILRRLGFYLTEEPGPSAALLARLGKELRGPVGRAVRREFLSVACWRVLFWTRQGSALAALLALSAALVLGGPLGVARVALGRLARLLTGR